MPPHKKPVTLYKLALETFGKVIATKCQQLDNICTTQDRHDFQELTGPLHDKLHAIVPHALYNDVCDAILTEFERYITSEQSTLYGVVVNDKLTSLRVCLSDVENHEQWIRIIVPRWKNLVSLHVENTQSPYNVDWKSRLIFAISRSCPSLERISFESFLPTTPREFCALIKCSKLRYINVGFSDLTGEVTSLAISKLPDLECLVDCNNIARILVSMGIRRKLNLRCLAEYNASPGNIRAAVNLCPHLQELELSPLLEDYTSDVLEILASSNLKLTKIKLSHCRLWNEGAVKFFKVKGKHIEHLNIDYCSISDILNFIYFIGIYCINLTKLEITNDSERNVISSFKFQIPSDKNPSFLKLKELCLKNFELYLTNYNVEVISTIMATATSIQRMMIDHYNVYWKRGNVDEDAIERMFPIKSMQQLRYLSLIVVRMTERMARHFMTNAPMLSRLIKPHQCTPEAERYMLDTIERYKGLNIDFKFY